MGRWSTSGIIPCWFYEYRFLMFNDCDDGQVNYFYYHEKEYPEAADLYLFGELSKGATNVIDIGANTGLFSIIGSKANASAFIHCFEPYQINAVRLRRNLELNNLANVEIHSEAMGETTGWIEISVPLHDRVIDVVSANTSFPGEVYPELAWKKVVVPLNTVDNFRSRVKSRIDLIKCDVETFEIAVFKGALETLRKDKPTIIFECFLTEEKTIFFNGILREYNYYAYLILKQGVVHCSEGFVKTDSGLNYLITNVKPVRSFISFQDTEGLRKELLFCYSN
jgi:FkbM family methyltransferase